MDAVSTRMPCLSYRFRDDHRCAFTVLRRSPRQSHISGSQKLKIVHTRTRQAERLLRFQEQAGALVHGRAAFGTSGFKHHIEYNRPLRLAELRLEPLLLSL